MEKKSFHLTLQANNKETLSNILGAVLQETLSEDSLLMVSCSKSSEHYQATVDMGGPEPPIV